MVLHKTAVSGNDTKSMNFKHQTSIPALHTRELIKHNAKHFNKNVFLSAFVLSQFFFAEQAIALSVQPMQVKSALGEPFRAQIIVSDIAGVNPSTIRASLASDSEFIQLGIHKQRGTNDLKFHTAITSPERGVITITSDRPLNDPYIEFVVHIGFGNNVRLQQVTALVDPPLTRIQPETLNLPVQHIQLAETTSTPAPVAEQAADPNIVKVTSSVSSRTIPMVPSRQAPPPMSASAETFPATPLAKEETPLIPSANTPPPMSTPAVENTPIEQSAAIPPATIEQVPPTPVAPTENNAYQVKRNDSLWAIATRIQKETNQPVTVIMRSIQQLNKAAFIHGNPNQIRSGATIILPNQPDIKEVPKTEAKASQTENDDVETNKTPVLRTPNQQAKAAKTPYVRRGHLPDAKMTLVAPPLEGTAQGSAIDKQSEENVRKLTQLNLKVTSARQRNMTLGQQVSELEAKIKANDQKLALRNARLAELMQRLKNRKDAASQNANRTPKS